MRVNVNAVVPALPSSIETSPMDTVRKSSLVIVPVASGVAGAVTLAALFVEVLPLPVVFLVASALALLVNYPDPHLQRERLTAHGGAGDSSVLTAYGVFQGMRAFLAGHALSAGSLLPGAALALLDIVLAGYFFARVFKHAVRQMSEACDRALDGAKLTGSDIDVLIPHQANNRIIEATAKHAGISMEKVYVNVDRFGNTSSASIPIAIDEAFERGRLRPGSTALLCAFGAGFTWGAAVVDWGVR